jgi:hypothetical protein
MSSSDSDAPIRKPKQKIPADATITAALRNAVVTSYKNDDSDNLTVNLIREVATRKLKLPEDFLKSDEKWKARSKEVIKDEVEKHTAKAQGREDDDDKDTKPSSKRAVKRKATIEAQAESKGFAGKPKKSKKRVASSEDEDEDDVVEEEEASSIDMSSAADVSNSPPRKVKPQPAKRKSVGKPTKGKAKTSKKRDAVAGSDEEDEELSDDEQASSAAEGKPAKRPAVAIKQAKRKGTDSAVSSRKKQKTVVDSNKDNAFEVEEPLSPGDADLVASSDAEDVKASMTEANQTNKSNNVEVPTEPELSTKAPPDDTGLETDYSDVIDEPAPSRGKKTKSQLKDKTSKPTTAKPAKPKAIAPTLSPQEEEIKRLQSWLVKCGVRKVWSTYFASQSLSSSQQKISHLKSLLKDVGMDGRFSEEKARNIKEEREFKKDLEEIKEGNEKWGESGEDEEEDEVGRAMRGKENGGGGNKPRRRLARGLKELEVFAGDEESD